ncbi:MAG: PQQ-dependent sugar dehydrogenase [Chloroflexi bacterium]|nr:PQQ-dependent sugar dehydrogenase [Chloroflexota bacterium]
MLLNRLRSVAPLLVLMAALTACTQTPPPSPTSSPAPAPATVASPSPQPTISAPATVLPAPASGTALPSGGATPGAATSTSAPAATLTPTAAPPAVFNPAAFKLELTTVVAQMKQPLFVTHAGDGSGAIYVVEKAGVVRVVTGGAVRPAPFLDITSLVRSVESERGLLGLAFHPNYRTNRQFFVDYTDLKGDTVIARYAATSEGASADLGSAKVLLNIPQPFANHNGGMLAFGPDGMLAIGMGDGGSGGDPQGNGQRRDRLLGKLLRIDVNRGDTYDIPADNPFAGDAQAKQEVWAIGLRNPWRFSFDRGTGDMWVADVGQNSWEEINVVKAGAKGGENFGWNRMEGTHCYPPDARCDRAGLLLPVYEYATNAAGNCSVTGGYVYRGRAAPLLVGGYIYGDYCSGRIWGLARKADGAWSNTELLDTSYQISSFGEDEAGELYLTALNGGVYRLGAAPR